MVISFLIDYILKDEFFLGFFDKNDIVLLINLINLLYYNIYKIIKNISLTLYFYYIQFYLVFIYNNTSNKFLYKFFYYFFLLKKNILYFSRFILRRIIKKRRWWKYYYKFGHISYLRVFIFLYAFLIFILMWKRRNTYLKRSFIINIIKLYLMSFLISSILVPFYHYNFWSILFSLTISFCIIFFRLN
jgi:hypothetical protein